MKPLLRCRVAWPHSRYVVALLACGGVLALAPGAIAQVTYTLIHRFESGARNPTGRLVEGPDGSLLGVTYYGGEDLLNQHGGGTIFALRPHEGGTWSFETVHQFHTSEDGASPIGGLVLGHDGNYYGVAANGGLPITMFSSGTIYRMSASGSLTVLHVFTGDDPVWRLTEASDGNFYGATCRGRYGETPTIFQMTPTGSLVTIHTFPFRAPVAPDPFEGYCPVTQLMEGADGFLYGDANMGGLTYGQFPHFAGWGTLFRIDPGAPGSSLTVLHAFQGPDGARPWGGLIPGRNGAFYGTTLGGGAFGKGLVYRRDASGVLATLHSFRGVDGAFPSGSLFRATDGALYGTTGGGGLGFGTVFRIDASGFSTVHRFTGSDGAWPLEIMQARDGSFYGVTLSGGPGMGGTVYRLDPGDTVTMLHAFAAGPYGPQFGVIQAADGAFYGTTEFSDLGGGSVFRLEPSGELTVLHDFAPPGAPLGKQAGVGCARLVQASDGSLYGTTSRGGAFDEGVVFRIGTAGGLRVLHSFKDASGSEGLIQASDGTFYGATPRFFRDGVEFPPTIFRMDASGHFVTLYEFPLDGSFPVWPLVEGPDGAIYGLSALGGGGQQAGTLFKITPTGEFTPLVSFLTGRASDYPRSGLIRASDGKMYGIVGTLFRFDPATNAVTMLYGPSAESRGLVEGRGGVLYWSSGQTFYRMAAPGVSPAEPFYQRGDADGSSLISDTSPLVVGSDGALYGTVYLGPTRHDQAGSWPGAISGGVFRLTVPPLP